MRVAFKEMYSEFERVLLKFGMNEEQAALAARLFTEASQDGIYSHGLNRFPGFIDSIKDGTVNVEAIPVFKESIGGLERWDGCCGPGNLNAYACTTRAIELAKLNSFGAVALSNTNHWMRPGAYGLMAAEADCIGVFWTNTMPNMPAWGGSEPKLGNNPLVISVPHKGVPVLFDAAMSQYSYGKLGTYALNNEMLPYDGGFDKNGNLTKNPSEILYTQQPLPIGLWKGAGLSLVLDLIAAVLSGGLCTREVGELSGETKLSQVFIAVNLESFTDRNRINEMIEKTLLELKCSKTMESYTSIRYPGEGLAQKRAESLENGILVEPSIWAEVQAL
ncbi:MAG: 3-dehydro-L-gulonate 2-dehydrogenase [Spirochaetales bacterium]|nr:3-dehydro-L-gulonate 2-dehydrogenase [Spirochaetales bacterium]